MRNAITFILLAGVLSSGSSCERALFDEPIRQDAVTTFEYMWNQCNEKYSFFDYKGIDWNEVHDRYRPLVSNNMGDDSLFNVLASMLHELRDAHVNLVSPFNVSHYDIELTGAQNFNMRNV